MKRAAAVLILALLPALAGCPGVPLEDAQHEVDEREAVESALESGELIAVDLETGEPSERLTRSWIIRAKAATIHTKALYADALEGSNAE